MSGTWRADQTNGDFGVVSQECPMPFCEPLVPAVFFLKSQEDCQERQVESSTDI